MAPPEKQQQKTVKTRSDSTKEDEVVLDKLEKLFQEISDFRQESNKRIDELKAICSEQRKDIDKCFDDIDGIKRENEVLRKTVSSLQQDINTIQQYSRKNTVDIQGIPESRSEVILQEVQKVAKALRFDLKSEMVDAVHRLSGGNSSRSRGVILKFVRRIDCDEFLRLAKVKNGFPASSLGFESENRVYVNPSLSQQNRELLFLARKAARDGAVKYAWYQNGRVLIRKKEGQPAIVVSSKEQLRNINDGGLGQEDPDQQRLEDQSP